MELVRAAFKEWAIIVDALNRGEQIMILRKGGIAEGKGGFQVDHPEFWLFPTAFHQQSEGVLPSAQSRLSSLQSELADTQHVTLRCWAKIAAWERIQSLEQAHRLQGQHLWREDVIEQRFEWGREQGLFALAVRVHRLHTPVRLPMISGYAGCKSWIDLESDLQCTPSQPVLDDAAFKQRLQLFRDTLTLPSQP